MGLQPQDCGTFHHRGRCSLPNCSRQHTSKVLETAKVDAAIAIFTTGMAGMGQGN
jgi:ribose 5-phosphate isomerase RpiB